MRTRHSTGGVRNSVAAGSACGATMASEKPSGRFRQGHDQRRGSRGGCQDRRRRTAKREQNRAWKFGEFVEQVYFPYYSRKWKDSTRENNVNRVSVHLVARFEDRELSSFRRDELQDLLDLKAKGRAVVFGRRSSAVGS